jgi:hypothetical protein
MEAQTLTFRQNSSLVKQRSESDWFVNSYRLDLSSDPNFLHLPNGNTAQRGTTTSGRIRFNIDLQCFEVTKSDQWNEIMVAGVLTSSTTYLNLPSGNAVGIANSPAGSIRYDTANGTIEATNNGTWWAPVTRQYEQTFSYNDLSNGTIILSHNLGNRFLTSAVFDEMNNHVIPDNLNSVDANTALLSVISFGTLVDNWSIILSG